MNKIVFPLVFFSICLTGLQAQILNKINNRVQETVESELLNKTESEKKNPIEEKKQNNNTNKTRKKNTENNSKVSNSTTHPASLLSYSNYDFIPGDKLIFYYDMDVERDSELPSRFLIDEGQAEIQTYENEKVLYISGNSTVYFHPQINSNAYLPEQFTLEFDILSNGGIQTTLDAAQLTLYFREKHETNGAYGSATAPIKILLSGISGDAEGAHYEFGIYKNDDWTGGGSKNFPTEALNAHQNKWRRVAIYVNKNMGKLYIDQHRIGVSNQIEPGKPAKIDFEVTTLDNPLLLKSFRIATGSTDVHQKIFTDGKYIAYGIQFDVNKSTLKPESMGTINEFAKLMKNNAEITFEIAGHTDNDGSMELNNQLSQQRAEAVKTQMVAMGIDSNRLISKGYGSEKPVVKNDNAENKARNRRVEFLRL